MGEIAVQELHDVRPSECTIRALSISREIHCTKVEGLFIRSKAVQE